MEDKNGIKTQPKSKVDSLLERYRLELEEDAKIVRSDLASHIMLVTTLQAKWLNYYTIYKEAYIKRSKRLKELRTKKFIEAISGHNGFSVTKSEAKNYIVSGDKDIVDQEEALEILELMMDFFSSAQQIIRDKAFAMGNVIRLSEFEAGK